MAWEVSEHKSMSKESWSTGHKESTGDMFIVSDSPQIFI